MADLVTALSDPTVRGAGNGLAFKIRVPGSMVVWHEVKATGWTDSDKVDPK